MNQQEPQLANPLAPLVWVDAYGVSWPQNPESTCAMLEIAAAQRLPVVAPNFLLYPDNQHWHLFCGNLQQMPIVNDQCRTRKEARELIRQAVNIMYDTCEIKHLGRCHIGSYKDGEVAYKPGHVIAYSKIVACYEPTCRILKEDDDGGNSKPKWLECHYRTDVQSPEEPVGQQCEG